LAEMEQRFSYSLEELARRFDRSVSWVARRLALVELLPVAIQQQVQAGKIAAQLAMKYLVPMARVSAEDCERMAALWVKHHCDTRQPAQLYKAWRDGSRLVRERILREPELFLKTQAPVHRYLERFAATDLDWPLPEDCGEAQLESLLFATRRGRPAGPLKDRAAPTSRRCTGSFKNTSTSPCNCFGRSIARGNRKATVTAASAICMVPGKKNWMLSCAKSIEPEKSFLWIGREPKFPFIIAK
jgi:hypothetical protein